MTTWKDFMASRAGRALLGLLAVGAIVAAAVGAVAAKAPLGAHAMAGECTLAMPDNPLSARGLAEPYELQTVDDANPCHEADPNTAVFVQAVIYDPATGALSVYDPLVVDDGDTPAIAPTPPALPPGAVVGIWIGSNGTFLHPEMAFPSSHCVLTYRGEPFGQEAWCNTKAFYAAVEQGIAAGLVHIPALGTASDGLPCPTTHDFVVVDQDPSDNVVVKQLIANNTSQAAQNTAANAAQLAAQGGYSAVVNGSDEGAVGLIDAALGCAPWRVPVLNDPGVVSAAEPLNELQAKYEQGDPLATIELDDPFALFYENLSLGKLNAYRAGKDQPPEPSLAQAKSDQVTWCQQLLGPRSVQRLFADEAAFAAQPSPFPAIADSLFTFLAQRWSNTYAGPLGTGANCQALLGIADPVALVVDANGVVVGATYAPQSAAPQAGV